MYVHSYITIDRLIYTHLLNVLPFDTFLFFQVLGLTLPVNLEESPR